jgi:hypothetical protein
MSLRYTPGQVPAFLQELHERGWTDQRIQQRVMPYLAMNPFYTVQAGSSAGSVQRRIYG